MTTTMPSRQRRPMATRLALVSAASLSLIGGSLAVAGPASAAGYDAKPDKKIECWVKAKDVHEKADYGKYSKKNSADVKFEFKVWCDKKTDVKFDHWIFQKKHGKWVLIKDRSGKIDNVKDKVTKHTKAEVKDTGRKGGEEKVYHVVKISYKEKGGKYSHTVTKKDSAYGTVDFGRY
ncbi:hypothetical protein LFT45_19085 [Arthrobacter sp. FW305-BF8]|uniref:hypothetical protein n=1 Tax=Arthrobacter sp. FW305-BF8 TaxID=2879617 RepID=UPI001F3D807E|nr:hypothetical protein [Arthrobacter sp. FW305-BF8]UKA53789.1 hypothetical protein LFT45_19085 [Arthrobacter sp. FW305-BF8]